jgi:hypothetical protein
MRQPKSLLIFCHNGSRFDWSFIVRAFAKYKAEGPEWLQKYDLSILPKSENQFLSLRIGNSRTGSLLFVDSWRHQSESLEALIQAQRKFGTLEEAFPSMSSLHPWRSKLAHILRKLPFPYDALKEDPDTWTEMPALLPREAFDNNLQQTKCSLKQYEELRQTFEEIGLTNFAELHACYLWTDVLALCDIMERYSIEFWHRFKLDPLHFLTVSSAAFAACLKAIGPCIELPSDACFVKVVNESVMGGISWAAAPLWKKTKGHRFHVFDACQLYPSQMVKPLPVGDYKQVVASDLMAVCKHLLETWTMDSDMGFLIVCDFHVPSQYHDEVDLPPCCKMKVTRKLLSKEQQHYNEGTKLIPYLGEHIKSGRHIALLQCWRKYCHIEITKVHQIWSFKQAPVLKDFIEEVVRCRREATTEVGRALNKLMSVSFFGKLLERVDQRCTARLTTDPWRFFKQTAKRQCCGWRILEGSDEMAKGNGFLGLYNMQPEKVSYSSPRAAAWAILDLSKVQYYTFHYGVLKHLWPTAKLYGMDTDSSMLSLPTENFLEKALEWNKGGEMMFDLSLFGHEENKGQLGCWKEELGQAEVTEAAFICAKTYALKMNEEDKLRAKGVPKAVLNSYRFETYKQLLKDARPVISTFEALRIVNQQSIKRTEIKKCLAAVNDKVWMERQGPEEWLTRPLGHYKNKENANH